MKDFKYKSSFSSEIKCLISEDVDKYLSKASLENLSALMPPQLIASSSIDLLPFVANGALINFANKNADALRSSDAIKIYKSFIHRPINIEHKRTEVLGHVINVGFSSLANDSLMSEDEAAISVEPFHISVAGYLYRLVNQDLVSQIEASSDPTAPSYHDFSLSWEILFNDYAIAKGPKNLAQATLITDPEEIKKLDPMLQANGGKGVDSEGNRLTRVISGDIYGGGFGIVLNPAGHVKGIHIPDISTSTASKEKNNENNKEIISQDNKTHVNKGDMKKLTSFAEIENLDQDELKDVSVASFHKVVADKIKELNEQRQNEVKTKEDSEAKAKQEAKAAQDQVEQLKKDVEALKNEKEISKAEADFNLRMSGLDENYDLEPADRAVIVKQIKTLDDSSFASWLTDFEVLAAKKKKDATKTGDDAQKAADKKIQDDKDAAKADDDSDAKMKKEKSDAAIKAAKEALAKLEESAASIPNTSSATQSLVEKYAGAFAKDKCVKQLKKISK